MSGQDPDRELETTVAGLKVEGDWEDMVDAGEEVSDILEASDMTEDGDLDDFDEWRPREGERPEDELEDRTVEQATVDEGPAEQAGKTAVDEAGEAVHQAEKAVGNVAKGDVDQASDRGWNALKDLFLSIDTVLRKALRSFEATIYRLFITKTNPQYFDSELVSASIDEKKTVTEHLQRKDVDDEDRRFEMRLNINQDDVKEEVHEEIEESSD